MNHRGRRLAIANHILLAGGRFPQVKSTKRLAFRDVTGKSIRKERLP